jgi:hypothetical protein
MDRLFSPCTRFYDIVEGSGLLESFGHDPELLQELDLNVSTEELLSTERAFTYADLHAMLGNEATIAWLTSHAAVIREHGIAVQALNQLDESYEFRFTVDGKEEIIAVALSPEHLSEICDVVLRLLAVNVVQSAHLADFSPSDFFINAPTLAYLMEQCQSLTLLSLFQLEMDEDQIRVLGTYSRPDLEIVLENCNITSAGASALAEVLGRNQGPTKLVDCRVDNFVLVNGLRGNSRLKSLTARVSGRPEDGNQELLAFAGGLKENKGLVYLRLYQHEFRLSDETWGAICDSFKTHPTLEVLNLRDARLVATPAPARIISQIQKLADVLKVNMSLHTVDLHDCYSQHELYRGSVVPYLETNRFRPRLLAIQKTCPLSYRAKVLGGALLAARTDANRVWMLLSGNTEVAFPSTTATTTLALALPAVAATAALTATATRAASTTTASAAADHVATSTPTADPKRQARP